MSIKIKDVEGVEIGFYETQQLPSVFGKVIAIVGFAITIMIMFYGVSIENDLLPGLGAIATVIWCVITIGLVFGSFFGMKGYVVFTGEKMIVIKSTTPEADQLAICKAAQELEVKAREIARKKRELGAIAAKCK